METGIALAKKVAGQKAVEYIKAGMTVGLGTGSTAWWAIQEIGARVKAGLDINAIATSDQSYELAVALQIPLITFEEITQIDVDIDGADEVDRQLQLIKGGGGALLREKIIAAASQQMIVAVDEHKLVDTLGKFPLPVEVVVFGWEMTARKLAALGTQTVLREKNGQPFITDNGNYIIDCAFNAITDPATLHTRLNAIPGVAENGLFVNYAHTVIVGYENGTVNTLYPAR
ncbi:ribose-5-phosphate isomerase RpiA [Chitinophaga defluvii]|uniref:Ribose-5-phosphate isomerase A n=1 Tax=Chitinophaga defluvii TaxID=3163343 RepID=A0ABV2T0K1_9BACT